MTSANESRKQEFEEEAVLGKRSERKGSEEAQPGDQEPQTFGEAVGQAIDEQPALSWEKKIKDKMKKS